jgi:DNA-binding HxlR family transcriptional regulator
MKNENDKTTCEKAINLVSDSIFVLGGKWRILVLIAIRFENKRFSEIAKSIPNITEKMLSKELRFLELNQLIKRTTYDGYPVKIEYAITEHGKTLDPILLELKNWAKAHRKVL